MLASWTRRRVLIAVVFVACFLRLWAAWQLPVDYDEPVYLQAGFDYARLLEDGDLRGVIDYPGNREHPPLVKLLYALPVLVLGEKAAWDPVLFAARGISVLFGVAAVWVVALFNPLAGALLAVQTLVVKYTSQAYLEALPLFGSLVAVLALAHSQRAGDHRFWLSAFALGLVAAGKYSYFPILFVLIYLCFWEKRFPWRWALGYLGAAGLAFLALNPALWADPAGRLIASALFHPGYSQSAHVQAVGYPWYQPFIWVGRSMPYQWHPQVFFYYGFDGLIALLALAGVRACWKNQRWVVVWMAAGMAALLLWPVKWPQYALVVLPAFCFAAAAGVADLVRRIREADLYWNWFEEMAPRPSRVLVMATVALLALATFGEMVRTVRTAMNQRGWRELNMENSQLPSDSVYDLASLGEGRMAAATGAGLALFSLAPETLLPTDWQVFHRGNSPLPDNRVLSLAAGPAGDLWAGTRSGLARYSPSDGSWTVYRGEDLGLAGEQVNRLEFDSHGRLWVAASGGLAVFDGQRWRAYTTANSPLVESFILALAVDGSGEREAIWAGARDAVYRLDTETGEWGAFTAQDLALAISGVSDLMVDSSGQVWLSTLGSGVGQWDGEGWSWLRISNSGLPSNTVRKVVETQPGVYWVATADPTDVGGRLLRFTGGDWTEYDPNNSGFNGAEPVEILLDEGNRLWIATRTGGIQIYRQPN